MHGLHLAPYCSLPESCLFWKESCALICWVNLVEFLEDLNHDAVEMAGK